MRKTMNLLEMAEAPVAPTAPVGTQQPGVAAPQQQAPQTARPAPTISPEKEKKLQAFADSIIENLGETKAIALAKMILAKFEQGTLVEQLSGQLNMLTEGVLANVAVKLIAHVGRYIALEIARRIMDRATKV